MHKILCIIFGVTLSCAAQAEMYKWVDPGGKVHYSDQPPPGAKTQQVESGKSKPAASAADKAVPKSAVPKSMADKEMDFNKRRSEAKEATAKKEKEAADAKQKQENCERSRETLRNFQAGGRIATTNEAGERVFLEDSGRQQAIDRAQKDVDSWCK